VFLSALIENKGKGERGIIKRKGGGGNDAVNTDNDSRRQSDHRAIISQKERGKEENNVIKGGQSADVTARGNKEHTTYQMPRKAKDKIVTISRGGKCVEPGWSGQKRRCCLIRE